MRIPAACAGSARSPGAVRRLDDALRELVQQAYGPPMLAVLALGLVLFGAFRVVDAVLRKPAEITHA